jgi:hypothetical protein
MRINKNKRDSGAGFGDFENGEFGNTEMWAFYLYKQKFCGNQ